MGAQVSAAADRSATDDTRADGAVSLRRKIELAHAEVLQAKVERDRLGVDIGNEPLPQQQAVYVAALARLRELEAQQQEQQT
jgi:hypothetical protein